MFKTLAEVKAAKSWENIKGYGARLSAPGYLDCTPFVVFDTQEEAEQYLTDEYPEDGEPEDDEDEATCQAPRKG